MSRNRKPAVPPSPPPSAPLHSSPGFWLKLLIITQLILLAAEFSPDISTNGDDARYYLLGKSIMTGNGYRDLFDPHNAVHTQYPPLFPALLGVADAFSHSPLLPKLVIGIMSACILLLLFSYFRTAVPNVTLPLLIFTAVSSSIATHATLLMSEIPYLFTSIAALVLYEKYKGKGGIGWLFWAATIVSLCPVFIRSAGLAFSGAWVLCALLDKRYKLAGAHLALFLGATLFLRLSTDWHNPYIDQLFRKNQYDPELGFVTASEMAVRIGQNIKSYLLFIIPQALAGMQLRNFSALLITIALMVPAIIGWIRNFMLPTRILSIYLLLYGGIICMWQVQWSGVRFIIPILPFIAWSLFLGLHTMVDFFTRRNKSSAQSANHSRLIPGILLSVALALMLFNIKAHLDLLKAGATLQNDWKNFYSCADWIRLNTPKDAIVVNRKPELFYLRAHRKGFVYPYSHDVEKVIAGIKKGGAHYCIFDNFAWTNTTARYLFPAILSHPELFKVVYSLRNPDTYILEFRTP